MIVQKVTTGFVVQTFDTKTGKFVCQTFVAGDPVYYEDTKGNSVDSFEEYLPFEMVQP